VLAGKDRHRLVFASPKALAASFELAGDGTLQSGVFVIEGQTHEWDGLGGLLVRPGRAWSMPLGFTSIAEGMTFHELRTAWCAVLAAFPGVVLDRLPPGWFLDARAHGASLAWSLARQLGCQAGFGPEREPDVPVAGALLLADEVLAADPRSSTDECFAYWLTERGESLADWQRDAGVRIARVEAWRRRDQGWTIQLVDAVPSLRGIDPQVLAQRCASLVGLLG
jgi:hypothetical protein